MIEVVGGVIVSLLICSLIYVYASFESKKHVTKLISEMENRSKAMIDGLSSPPPPQVNVNMKPVEDAVREIPNRVLKSIQSSVNARKGVLGELIGYIELEAQYDRIIPLGNIVDFVCIRLPSSTKEGCIDFVDIKTGKFARLSKEQKALQQLITDKKINFVKLTVNTQSSETFHKTNQ